jgi:hypothetical protein
MPGTKRIVLNLTTQEFEELHRAVHHYWTEAPLHDAAYPGQVDAINRMVCKVDENYERNGCP